MTSLADVIERELSDLEDLKERGIITEEEYQEQRKTVLSTLQRMTNELGTDGAQVKKRISIIKILGYVFLSLVVVFIALAVISAIVEPQ